LLEPLFSFFSFFFFFRFFDFFSPPTSMKVVGERKQNEHGLAPTPPFSSFSPLSRHRMHSFLSYQPKRHREKRGDEIRRFLFSSSLLLRISLKFFLPLLMSNGKKVGWGRGEARPPIVPFFSSLLCQKSAPVPSVHLSGQVKRFYPPYIRPSFFLPPPSPTAFVGFPSPRFPFFITRGRGAVSGERTHCIPCRIFFFLS